MVQTYLLFVKMLIKQITEKKLQIAEKEYKDSLVISFNGQIYDWKKKKKFIDLEDLNFLNLKCDVLIIAKTENMKEVKEDAQNKLKEYNILLIFDDLQSAVNCYNLMVKFNKKVFGIFVL